LGLSGQTQVRQATVPPFWRVGSKS
jgi:hypothetical protein